MAVTDTQAATKRGGPFAPFKAPVFRNIWTASLFSNFGHLILGVGAAWEMTRLTSTPTMVALVQTALMLPLMLVAVPAGAIADMFDRRKVAIVALSCALLSSALLTALSVMGLMTPWLILAFLVLIGAGVALYYPTWQASLPELVSADQLPAAVALGTISFNIARSVGPAIGGIIVVAAGASTAFGLNAIFYLPILLVFMAWRRQQTASRLPPERIGRAIVSGARYALHSASIRRSLYRIFAFCLAFASAYALAPLIARDVLGGDASTYGVLLGALGVGAVSGALLVSRINERFSTETAMRILATVCASGMCLLGLSEHVALTCVAMFILGASSILMFALANISVQFSSPRWVIARALSLFQAALAAGMALGSWGWGVAAGLLDLRAAVLLSAGGLLLNVLVGFLLPLPRFASADVETAETSTEPEVALELTMRSGPVSIEIDYDVAPDKARDFYGAMQVLRQARLRNGGFDWSLSRDIANPALWTERFQCPTWGDYLRLRDRQTQADLMAQAGANAFNRFSDKPHIRRRLERPFGSVRWKSDTPDPKVDGLGVLGP